MCPLFSIFLLVGFVPLPTLRSLRGRYSQTEFGNKLTMLGTQAIFLQHY